MQPEITRAFVLGAGLGTRLKRLTMRRPKPLIPVCGKPLITFAFEHLKACGIERLIVNTHHCPEVYGDYFPSAGYGGLPIEFRHEPDLLETGGGIRNIEDLLGEEPFVVYNGDILTDLPLQQALEHHRHAGSEVTMILRSGGGPLQVAFDPDSGRVQDLGGRLGREGTHLFAGIYVVEPRFLERIPPDEKVSVIPSFIEMIREGAAPAGIVLDEGAWWDLGTREKYLDVHEAIHRGWRPGYPVEPARNCTEWPRWIHPEAEVAPGARIEGATAIGAGARIGRGAQMKDCVAWSEAEVKAGACLERCVITTFGFADRDASGEDF